MLKTLLPKEITYNEKTETVVVTDIEQPYISAPDQVTANRNITLNADSTNLPGWKIARYYWNFGDETVAVGKNVTKSYLKPGNYNIQLIVTDEPDPGISGKGGMYFKKYNCTAIDIIFNFALMKLKKSIYRILFLIFLTGFILPGKSSAQPVPGKDENIPFLVTFGKDGKTSWGDDNFYQIFFFSIPKDYNKPFYIRVFDPDCGGENDEIQGEFNSKTKFSVYGGKGVDPDQK